ncbi:unnamed protein product [Ceratitis capitata]|uniref:(Mediterranean fruit fly) hypothetical protein n=1 Tax=Ceratitis capitata TaxID=7213 RepID=A0A811V1I9_CERCA|nr:unnamed protein product [Ceratitis capitata]
MYPKPSTTPTANGEWWTVVTADWRMSIVGGVSLSTCKNSSRLIPLTWIRALQGSSAAKCKQGLSRV